MLPPPIQQLARGYNSISFNFQLAAAAARDCHDFSFDVIIVVVHDNFDTFWILVKGAVLRLL